MSGSIQGMKKGWGVGGAGREKEDEARFGMIVIRVDNGKTNKALG